MPYLVQKDSVRNPTSVMELVVVSKYPQEHFVVMIRFVKAFVRMRLLVMNSRLATTDFAEDCVQSSVETTLLNPTTLQLAPVMKSVSETVRKPALL